MSKQALSLLAKSINDDVAGDTWQGGSKSFRQKNLDYQTHFVQDFTQQDIENQIRQQVAGFDSEKINAKGQTTKEATNIYDVIDAAGGFPVAAKAYYDALKGSFTAAQKEAAKEHPGIFAVVNNYDDLNKRRFKPAEAAAMAVLNRYTTDDRLLSKRLLSPDHTYTNADIRFSRALYNATEKANPDLQSAYDIQTTALNTLHDLFSKPYNGKGLISVATYEYFVDVFTEISSKYTSNLTEKTFDIKIGAEIAPRSQFDNEDHGRIIAGFTSDLAKAASLIAAKQNWEATKSSDDYVTAVMKTLNNAVVKGGGSGKIQSIDTTPSKAKQSKKIKIKKKVKTVKVGSKNKPKRSTVAVSKSKPSQLSLAKIVAYINARLPQAVCNNMGTRGALVNRSGRFSQSAKLVGGVFTPQGYPSLNYTYQRSPYDVFDPVLGRAPWNTPERSPRVLIEKSVRDIAREISIGRFYLRRT